MILVHWNHLRKFQSGSAVASEITLVTSGSYNGDGDGTTQDSFTITGIQANDVIIIHMASDTGNDVWSESFDKGTSIWSVDQSVTSIAGYYVATGTSETFSTVADGDEFFEMENVVYSVWRGCDTNNPIEDFATSSQTSSTSTTIPLPSVTTTVDGCVIIAGFALDDDNFSGMTIPSGYTFLEGVYNTTGGSSSNVKVYKTQTTAGTESGGSFFVPTPDPNVSFRIALKPA